MNHPPEPRVVLADHTSDRFDRHVRRHGENESFEKKGKAASGPAPRNGDRSFSALRAINSRNARPQDRLMLEKVQVSPFMRFCVIRLASRRAAFWASERAASSEVDPDL